MRYFPIFADFGSARVLIVGGGAEAANKVRLLLKTEARIEIVAERLNPELDGLVSHGGIAWAGLGFESGQLDGVAAVFSAADEKTNEQVSAAARSRNIPVNVVDRPELSSFIVPAIVDRDPLVVAIGTEGTGPVLAQGIRARIEALIPARIGELALAARKLRETINSALPPGAARRGFWQNFFFGGLRDAFLSADRQKFVGAVERQIASKSTASDGCVVFVGTGPGDPELLTLRAHRELQEADVIAYDRFAPAGMLDYARRDAERIALRAGEEAPEILIREAEAGRKVVRLSAGDPTASVRIASERRTIEASGIPVDLVPGIGTRILEGAQVLGFPSSERRRAAS
jgi:uroporphyrin-III C-methyltransferase/precorrin-2 dehydrogenase/sirohydrochlorin ferrochelatase